MRHNLLIDCWVAPYGQAIAEACRPDSDFANSGAEMALLASDYRSLGLARPKTDAESAEAAVKPSLARITTIASGLERLHITPILQTVPLPADPWLGSYDAQTPGAPATLVSRFNAELLALARAHGALILDSARIAALVGQARWFDDALWNRSKIPFALEATPLWADHLVRLLGAARGKARKCLVLDLDNVRRQNIWRNLQRRLAESGPRLGVGFRWRACGVASVDVR